MPCASGSKYCRYDAPRDKRTYFREINYIAAAFQYQKKNYNSA
ncbi:glucosamine-6-phosphate deaminase [Escherichia coli]|nr:glucosamine-6-phosphate deaminase [Escherichia coli]